MRWIVEIGKQINGVVLEHRVPQISRNGVTGGAVNVETMHFISFLSGNTLRSLDLGLGPSGTAGMVGLGFVEGPALEPVIDCEVPISHGVSGQDVETDVVEVPVGLLFECERLKIELRAHLKLEDVIRTLAMLLVVSIRGFAAWVNFVTISLLLASSQFLAS